jgi:hypothetical protein
MLLALLANLALARCDERSPAQQEPRTALEPRAGQESRELAARRALEAGLAYLVARAAESVDGAFPVDDARDKDRAPLGVTALATLAFLGAGHSPGRGPYGETVARAVDYLLEHVDLAPESPTFGYISQGGDALSRTHGHGYATLALAQAHGMARERSERLQRSLVAAVHCIEKSQGTEGGWYYQPRFSAEHEGSVTICLVQALRAAQNVGVQVDSNVIARAEDYIARLQNPDGTFRYGLAPGEQSSLALTAAGIVTLNSAGRYEGPVLKNALDALTAGIARQDEGLERPDFACYQRFYLAQALWQLDDPAPFAAWYTAEARRLIASQEPDGSWDDRRFGRCYATATNCLVLALPEGLLPIFQR